MAHYWPVRKKKTFQEDTFCIFLLFLFDLTIFLTTTHHTRRPTQVPALLEKLSVCIVKSSSFCQTVGIKLGTCSVQGSDELSCADKVPYGQKLPAEHLLYGPAPDRSPGP